MTVSVGYTIDTKANLEALDTSALISGYARLVLSENSWFWYNPSSTATSDDINILSPTSNTGRWFKITSSVDAANVLNLRKTVEDFLGYGTFVDTTTISKHYNDTAHNISFTVLDNSITDEYINTNAAIAQSKINGLAASFNDKSNVNHTHLSSAITDFNEAVDDRVAALLQPGSNITLGYNDSLNTLTISASGSSGGSGGGSANWTSTSTNVSAAAQDKLALNCNNNSIIVTLPASPTNLDEYAYLIDINPTGYNYVASVVGSLTNPLNDYGTSVCILQPRVLELVKTQNSGYVMGDNAYYDEGIISAFLPISISQSSYYFVSTIATIYGMLSKNVQENASLPAGSACCTNSQVNPTLTYDFGYPVTLNRLMIGGGNHYQWGALSYAPPSNIEYSTDGTTWTTINTYYYPSPTFSNTISTIQTPQDSGNNQFIINSFAPQTARYWRATKIGSGQYLSTSIFRLWYQ